MTQTARSHAGRALVVLGLLSVLGACAPTPPAPTSPQYLFAFNRTNEPTVFNFIPAPGGIGSDTSINGILSGQLGIAATTSVSGTVRVDCAGLSGQDVEVQVVVRHNAIPRGAIGDIDSYRFSGVCNTQIAVSIPTTSFVATDSFWLIPRQQLNQGGGIAGNGDVPTPIGTVTTFAIHSDALVPDTINL
jgi:hypothetical protein